MIACAACRTSSADQTPREHPDFRHCPTCKRGTLCFDFAAASAPIASTPAEKPNVFLEFLPLDFASPVAPTTP